MKKSIIIFVCVLMLGATALFCFGTNKTIQKDNDNSNNAPTPSTTQNETKDNFEEGIDGKTTLDNLSVALISYNTATKDNIGYTMNELPNDKISTQNILKNGVIQEETLSSILADVENAICNLNTMLGEIRTIFLDSSNKTLTQESVSEFKKSMLGYQIQRSGLCVKGQIFNGTGFKISLYDNDTEVAGIEVDNSGGKLTGTWR